MFSLELGQTKSVLILYGSTILFSLCSYLYLYDRIAATILFLTLMLLFEIFVEATNMIDRKYKPILTIANIFIKSEYLPSIKDTKPYRKIAHKAKKQYAIILVLLLGIVFSLIFIINNDNEKEVKYDNKVVYEESKNETKIMEDIYNQLKVAVNNDNRADIGQLVGAYFICDYYTLSNKSINQIGGIDYFYNNKKDNFKTYAQDDYYKVANEYINNHTNTQEVINYEILSYDKSTKALKGLEDYSYYDLKIKLHFNEMNSIIESDEITTTVTLIEKDQKFSVIAIEE